MSFQGPLSRPEAEALLQRATELSDTSEYEQAAAAYARLVGHSDPEIHVVALLGLAEARYRLDDEPGALQAWITATQAPETSNTWRAWKALAAARVRENDMAGATRCYREALRRAPPDEQAEISSRLGWLTRGEGGQAGITRTSDRYFQRSRAVGMSPPYVTYSILAITVVIGLLVITRQADDLYNLLQLDKDALARGEWWRLFTVVLVHDPFSVFHLAFNMYALWIVGPIVEALYGAPRYLGAYLLTAAAGSAASYLFTPGDSVGASGAIFGLFGMLLVAHRFHRPALTRNQRTLTTQLGMLIAINLAIGLFIPNIDVTAHIGGLIAGAWLGFLLVPRGAGQDPPMRRPIAPGPMTGIVLPPQAPAAATALTGASDRLLRLAGVIALMAVIAIAVVIGPSL